MVGYRILAIVLGLICLAMPVSIFFQGNPTVVQVENMVLADQPLHNFLVSATHENKIVKNHLKYGIGGAALISLGMALMFFISVFNPRGMRPFIVVVIICSILSIPLSIWAGLRLNITNSWWIGDAVSGLVLAVLLLIFYPRGPKARKVSAPAAGEEELTE